MNASRDHNIERMKKRHIAEAFSIFTSDEDKKRIADFRVKVEEAYLNDQIYEKDLKRLVMITKNLGTDAGIHALTGSLEVHTELKTVKLKKICAKLYGIEKDDPQIKQFLSDLEDAYLSNTIEDSDLVKIAQAIDLQKDDNIVELQSALRIAQHRVLKEGDITSLLKNLDAWSKDAKDNAALQAEIETFKARIIEEDFSDDQIMELTEGVQNRSVSMIKAQMDSPLEQKKEEIKSLFPNMHKKFDEYNNATKKDLICEFYEKLQQAYIDDKITQQDLKKMAASIDDPSLDYNQINIWNNELNKYIRNKKSQDLKAEKESNARLEANKSQAEREEKENVKRDKSLDDLKRVIDSTNPGFLGKYYEEIKMYGSNISAAEIDRLMPAIALLNAGKSENAVEFEIALIRLNQELLNVEDPKKREDLKEKIKCFIRIYEQKNKRLEGKDLNEDIRIMIDNVDKAKEFLANKDDKGFDALLQKSEIDAKIQIYLSELKGIQEKSFERLEQDKQKRFKFRNRTNENLNKLVTIFHEKLSANARNIKKADMDAILQAVQHAQSCGVACNRKNLAKFVRSLKAIKTLSLSDNHPSWTERMAGKLRFSRGFFGEKKVEKKQEPGVELSTHQRSKERK